MRHRERLLPPVWLFAVCLLVVPAAVLVFLPISPVWGWIVAAALYAAVAIFLVVASPVVAVDDATLSAGRARIPLAALGEPEVLDAAGSYAALHAQWDARAYHSTVPWTRLLVRVPVTDPADPTTAWVLSTRRPDALAAAIRDARG
ncbi:DUF3093 domain-containing protein [Agrococcus sp. SGAir0287]|uniref:DUF3093 domain-containing protein n=1 Tax=Agrococcus sp. SGAir0287 TaxID=2070347 RepID=UPI0020C766A7|nr:DUF3093 domain-containing protein [Agrococcus sp. SGAir0287]